MKKSEDRRSFIFGVGAFAAALLMPKAPKLIFPIHKNPIVTPSDVEVLSMWTDCNRIGSEKVFFWIARVVGSPARIYEKRGAPPLHLFDFDRMVTAADAQLTTNYPVFNPRTGACIVVPSSMKKQPVFQYDIQGRKTAKMSQQEFCAKAWATEKESDQDESA